MPDLTPSGRITAGGMTVLADEAAREVQVEASIADMILADVLAMNWRLVITCLNLECGHGAEPSMSQIAVGFRRKAWATPWPNWRAGCTARPAAAGGCISTTARAGPSPT
jgi:hypothetical protein